MKRVRRWSRLVTLLGILIALLGLTGFWLSSDVQRTVLSPAEQRLVNPGGDAFQVSFVLAGRDYDHDEPAGPLVRRGGELVRSFVTEARLGLRTDTIIYVNIVGNRVYMVSIPRDIMLSVPATIREGRRIGINEVYEHTALYRGANRADNLRRAVAELLDLPVDYYVVINIDIFEKLVDAVGGVEVEVPQKMEYTDQAGGLEIDLEPGVQRLSGEQAAGFVRYREYLRGDIDRIDNVKTLAYALLNRLQELNVRVLGTLPALAETFFDEVDTNLSPALVAQLVPRLNTLQLVPVTLPTHDVEGSGRFVRADPEEVEAFLAELFGGSARPVSQAPPQPIMLSNRSGLPGLAARVRAQLLEMGIPAGRIRMRQGGSDAVTRVVTTHAGRAAAPFYADLFGVGWQQVDRLALDEEIEIILGQDARTFHAFASLGGGQP